MLLEQVCIVRCILGLGMFSMTLMCLQIQQIGYNPAAFIARARTSRERKVLVTLLLSRDSSGSLLPSGVRRICLPAMPWSSAKLATTKGHTLPVGHHPRRTTPRTCL